MTLIAVCGVMVCITCTVRTYITHSEFSLICHNSFFKNVGLTILAAYSLVRLHFIS